MFIVSSFKEGHRVSLISCFTLRINELRSVFVETKMNSKRGIEDTKGETRNLKRKSVKQYVKK
jgi:hypothetical protein